MRDLRVWIVLSSLPLLAAPAAARPLPEGMKTAPIPGGAWRNAVVDGAAVACEFDMGSKRVNWNHAKWAVLDLPAPADLSAWDGLHKDLIDAAIGRVDGVCEHHDQGHTDGMAVRSRSTRPC